MKFFWGAVVLILLLHTIVVGYFCGLYFGPIGVLLSGFYGLGCGTLSGIIFADKVIYG